MIWNQHKGNGMAYDKNVRYNGDDTQMAKLRGGVESRVAKKQNPANADDEFYSNDVEQSEKGQAAVDRQKKIKAARKRRKAKRAAMEKNMKNMKKDMM